jgi:hypothetical protein
MSNINLRNWVSAIRKHAINALFANQWLPHAFRCFIYADFRCFSYRSTHICTLFLSTADPSHTSFLNSKLRHDPLQLGGQERPLSFFASANRAAKKCDRADYDTLKQIAAAKFDRQRAAIGLDKKKVVAVYASAAADTARRSHTVPHTVATAAMVVGHDALQDAQHLANAATIVATASSHVWGTLCIINMHELDKKLQGLQCGSRRGAKPLGQHHHGFGQGHGGGCSRAIGPSQKSTPLTHWRFSSRWRTW